MRIGGLETTPGELKGLTIDVVSPPLVVNVGRLRRCPVGGSVPRPLKDYVNVKEQNLLDSIPANWLLFVGRHVVSVYH